MAYDNIEPFGEERADLRMAVLASLIANIHRGKGQRLFRPTDFLLFRDPDEARASAEKDLKAMFGRMMGRAK